MKLMDISGRSYTVLRLVGARDSSELMFSIRLMKHLHCHQPTLPTGLVNCVEAPLKLIAPDTPPLLLYFTVCLFERPPPAVPFIRHSRFFFPPSEREIKIPFFVCLTGLISPLRLHPFPLNFFF